MASYAVKIVYMPTQLYGGSYGKVGRKFVSTLSVELNVIQSGKWNSEQVIVFHLVILQRTQAVNSAKNVHA